MSVPADRVIVRLARGGRPLASLNTDLAARARQRWRRLSLGLSRGSEQGQRVNVLNAGNPL